MRVLIYEPFANGHRLQFVRMCVEAIGDLAARIVLATSDSTPDSDEFSTHLNAVRHRLDIDATHHEPPITQPLRAATARLSALKSVLRRHKPDHAYIPYADGLAQTAGVARMLGRSLHLGGLEIEAILMRGRFAYPRAGWSDGIFGRAWLAATSRAPLDIIHHLDPIPYEAIVRRGGALAARSRLIPEPVEKVQALDREAARRQLGLPPVGRYFCCPGSLDQRKGVDLLVRAFARACGAGNGGRDLRDDDRLLLVGRVDPAIADVLRQHEQLIERGRIIVHEGCVSDERLHTSMSAADVVCAPYPRHVGSSGIVVRAAALGRMVLTSDFGWLGMVTPRFGLGMACDCRGEQSLSRALPAALEASRRFQPSSAAWRFSQFHTQENFARHIAARLRERCGQAPATDLRSWAWVLQDQPQPQGS